MNLSLDFHDPDLIADPYPFYGRLRSEQRIFETEFGNQKVFVVSRFHDVATVLNDKNTLVNKPGTTQPELFKDSPAGILWRNAISRMDPPQHTDLRRAVSKQFTVKHLNSLKPSIEKITQSVFDDLTSTRINVVEEIATKVPLLVICSLLGIPRQDWEELQQSTDQFLKIFLPDQLSGKEVEEVNAASDYFIEYFSSLIKNARQKTNSNLTSELIFGPLRAGLISPEQLIGFLRGLFTAGFETTAATISASFLGFAKQTDQFERMSQMEAAIPNAVNEILRWETPVQAMIRYSSKDLLLGNVLVGTGSALLLLTGSSNRDPNRYQQPDIINIHRDSSDHHSFGGGRHYCLGFHLAKLEIETVLNEMCKRFSNIELECTEIQRKQNLQFRSITSLPVRLSFK